MSKLPPRLVIRVAWKAHRALVRYSGGRLGLTEAQPDKEGLAQLTTMGRKSGQERVVMIAYFRDGKDYVTMAMNGWDEADPSWWLNMQANPDATLLASSGEVAVTGRAAEPGTEHDLSLIHI